VNVTSTHLWNMTESANILGIEKAKLKGVLVGLGIKPQLHPSRHGLFLDLDELERVADVLGLSLDRDGLLVA